MRQIRFKHKKLLQQCRGLKVVRIVCSVIVLMPWAVGEIAWAMVQGGALNG